jgi:hypothetical protein
MCYVSGDSVSSSRNQKCRHAFHTLCIREWLEQMEWECPVCRGLYLEQPKLKSDECIADPENQNQIKQAIKAPSLQA